VLARCPRPVHTPSMDPQPDLSAPPALRARRRVAALVVALLGPAGAGLVVLGRQVRAYAWTAAELAALALSRWWPLPAISALVLLAMASIADAGLAAPRRRGVPGVLATAIALAAFLAVVFLARFAERRFVAEPYRMPTPAMVPALLDGDHFIVDRMPGDLARGDVVVYRAPEAAAEPGILFAKRMVAMGGDLISWKDGHLFINGADVSEDGPSCSGLPGVDPAMPCVARRERLPGGASYVVLYLGKAPAVPFSCPSGMERRGDACLVPPGTVFLLGDNRVHSFDSRIHGPVPLSAVAGRAVGIHLSYGDGRIRWSRMGLSLRAR